MAQINKEMTILVVDDMSNMRRTIRGMLRNMGFESLLEASNGIEALEKIRSQKIDFIVTDWNMPKMSGFELLKNIRDDEDNKNIPILMVTAEITEEQVAHAAETLVDGYIIKPFVYNTFEAKMHEVMDKRSKPPPIDTLMNVANILIKGNQISRAVEELTKGLKKYPKSARLHIAMGEAMEKNGEDDKAEEYYKEACEVNPMFTKAHERMADLLTKQKRTGDALKSLEKAAKISPNNPKRQKEMGMIHLVHGDKTKAKVALNIALKQAGGDNKMSTEIGEAFMDAGMADLAATAFKQTLASDPKNLNVYNRLGIALRKKGRFGEAVTEYKKALSIAPDDEVLHFNLAKAYHDSRKKKEALEEIKVALKIDPNFKEAREFLEQLEVEMQSFI